MCAPKISPLCHHYNHPGLIWYVSRRLTHFSRVSPNFIVQLICPIHLPRKGFTGLLLAPLLSQYPLHILGGDFNTCLSPLDSIGVLNTHPWPWLQNLVSGNIPSLIDSFRLFSPNTQGYTRPPSPLHPFSKSRLDYFFISPNLHSTFPLLSSSIIYSDSTSDHFPISLSLKSPYYPTPTTSPPPILLHKLNNQHQLIFQFYMDQLLPTLPPHPPGDLPWEAVQRVTTQIFWAISKAYQLTTQPHKHKQTSEEKFIHQLITTLPPPASPLLPSHLQNLEHVLSNWSQNHRKRSSKALHSQPIRGLKLKRAIAKFLQFGPPPPITLRDPSTGLLTTDPEGQCRIMSEALLTMGGPLNLSPPKDKFSSLISLSPVCTFPHPLPPIDYEWFQNKLNQSKPDKAGGIDGTNLYLWSLSPLPIKTWLFQV